MPHVIKGSKIPKPPPSDCQGFCGVCGVTTRDGWDPVMLATFTHHDGKPLSCCAKCYKWYHIKEGTSVKRYGMPASRGGHVLELRESGTDSIALAAASVSKPTGLGG